MSGIGNQSAMAGYSTQQSPFVRSQGEFVIGDDRALVDIDLVRTERLR